MELLKIVARYTNGKIIKGSTYDFFPNKDRFHVVPTDNPLGGSIGVIMNQLKAIFVVRDFSGDPGYVERKKYMNGQNHFQHGFIMNLFYSFTLRTKRETGKMVETTFECKFSF